MSKYYKNELTLCLTLTPILLTSSRFFTRKVTHEFPVPNFQLPNKYQSQFKLVHTWRMIIFPKFPYNILPTCIVYTKAKQTANLNSSKSYSFCQFCYNIISYLTYLLNFTIKLLPQHLITNLTLKRGLINKIRVGTVEIPPNSDERSIRAQFSSFNSMHINK